MQRVLVSSCLVYLALAGASACGSVDDGTGSVPEADFPRQFASAVCNAMTNCCQAHAFAHPVADCETSISGQLSASIAARDAGKTIYDAAAAGRCIDAYVAVFTGCGRDQTDPDVVCADVFHGTVAKGGACGDDEECASGLACENSVCATSSSALEMAHAAPGESCSGTCTEASTGADGVTETTCVDVGFNGAPPCWTSDHLTCDSARMTCVPVPKIGEACESDCDVGAYCESGTCLAQRNTGSCLPNPSACSPASYCQVDTQLCVPKQADGTACTTSEVCSGNFCTNGTCGPKIPVSADVCAGNFG
jgi:hypothetical protein